MVTKVSLLSVLLMAQASTLLLVEAKDCIPGGFCPIETNSDRVNEMALFAVDEIREREQVNSPYELQLGSIDKAESQVVAGVNYRMTLNIQLLNCADGRCQNIETRQCEVTVFDQAWTKTRKLTNVSCIE